MTNYQELYENIMESPNAEKIPYSISANYVKNLDAVFGIKEFIANFYDVNKENFSMDYKNKQLILKDDNTGIDIRYMIIGNSGSRESSDKIGEHGEGFKVGALTLVRLGYKVLIETVGYTIAFGIEKSELLNSEVMFAKYIKNSKTKGTTLFTECNKQSFEKAKRMFLHLSEHTKITDNIIEMDGIQKNIYLNGLSHTQKRAIFAYNIFEKNLVSNRDRNFISMTVLKEQISSIYNNLYDEEAISLIAERIKKHYNDFEKLLESKIFPELVLDPKQRSMFRDCFDDNVYYSVKGSNVSLEGEGMIVIEVDNSLFQFLNLIGANTLYSENNGELKNKDGVIAFYSFKKEDVPDSFDVESAMVTMLFDKMEFDTDITEFNPNKGWGRNFFYDVDLDEFLAKFKVTTSVQKVSSYSVKFKIVLNNLLLLACHGFKVVIYRNNFSYEFRKETINGIYNITIKKSESKNKEEKIIIKKSLGFKNNIKVEDIQYIYYGCLRKEIINGMFSYQLDKNIEFDRYRSELSVKSILQRYANTNPKKFIDAYLENINQNMYEHSLNIEPNNRARNTFVSSFAKKFPTHVIKSGNKEFDTVVKNNYGYDLLEIPNQNCSNFLKNFLEVKTSEDVFIEKQKESIHTIPNTDSMNEAIQIFKAMHGDTNIPIHTTPMLPNNSESVHKDGEIFISMTASDIPLYLAVLIEYEYTQMIMNLKKISHGMQSHLTHHVL